MCPRFSIAIALTVINNVVRGFKQRQRGRRGERHSIKENPKDPLRITGGEQVDVLRFLENPGNYRAR